MASKPSQDTPEEGANTSIPAAVIAQAESAIIGNFEDPGTPKERRPSRAAKPDYSQYQNLSRQSTRGEGTSR